LLDRAPHDGPLAASTAAGAMVMVTSSPAAATALARNLRMEPLLWSALTP
jgi:hypothetical protein